MKVEDRVPNGANRFLARVLEDHVEDYLEESLDHSKAASNEVSDGKKAPLLGRLKGLVVGRQAVGMRMKRS